LREKNDQIKNITKTIQENEDQKKNLEKMKKKLKKSLFLKILKFMRIISKIIKYHYPKKLKIKLTN